MWKRASDARRLDGVIRRRAEGLPWLPDMAGILSSRMELARITNGRSNDRTFADANERALTVRGDDAADRARRPEPTSAQNTTSSGIDTTDTAASTEFDLPEAHDSSATLDIRPPSAPDSRVTADFDSQTPVETQVETDVVRFQTPADVTRDYDDRTSPWSGPGIGPADRGPGSAPGWRPDDSRL